jgi:hypothetical protein
MKPCSKENFWFDPPLQLNGMPSQMLQDWKQLLEPPRTGKLSTPKCPIFQLSTKNCYCIKEKYSALIESKVNSQMTSTPTS